MGARNGTLTVILYLIIGCAGVPVFAEFGAGVSKLIGPTGGFLIGFIPQAFFMGLFMEKLGFTLKNALIANILGMFITLFFGTAWLKISVDYTLEARLLASGFTPFIIVGIIKAVIASSVVIFVRKRLISSKLLITRNTNIAN